MYSFSKVTHPPYLHLLPAPPSLLCTTPNISPRSSLTVRFCSWPSLSCLLFRFPFPLGLLYPAVDPVVIIEGTIVISQLSLPLPLCRVHCISPSPTLSTLNFYLSSHFLSLLCRVDIQDSHRWGSISQNSCYWLHLLPLMTRLVHCTSIPNFSAHSCTGAVWMFPGLGTQA